MNLTSVFIELFERYLNNRPLTDYVEGKLESLSPLTVKVKKLPLTEDDVVIPKHLKADITVGNTLLLLRACNGQKFIVLGVKEE